MNAYESRKQRRIDGLNARAERLRSEADSTGAAALQMASVIPLGQPILVGHHSEGRDRRYRARIDAKFERAAALDREASEAARRAAAAESNTAISSDDPDAVAKLTSKLAKLEDVRKRMVDANKAIRAKRSDEVLAAITGIPVAEVGKLREPDCFGNVGFAPYKLTNLGNEIRRLKARIEELGRKAAAPILPPETVGRATIEEADNRVRVRFPSKPHDRAIDHLKAHGFRWAPSENAWQRMASVQAWVVARTAAEVDLNAPLLEEVARTCAGCGEVKSVGANERTRWSCYGCGRINGDGL